MVLAARLLGKTVREMGNLGPHGNSGEGVELANQLAINFGMISEVCDTF
jgi:hypothetical protein